MCWFLWFTYRDEKLLNKLSLNLKSRAVDNDYYFYLDNLSFYHAHLSISDLNKNTSQPFFQDNIIIWFVWEVYNKQKLLDFLWSWEKEDDFTELEVIYKSYKKFWKEFINLINWEYSIFIYDLRLNKIFLFRDRWWTNNIYYKIKDWNLYFSSEIKSLIFEKTKLSKKAFIEYLTFQFCISPNTIVDDIFSLRPWSILEFSNWNFNLYNFLEYKPQYNFVNIIDAIEHSIKSRIPKFQDKVFLSLSWWPDSNLILFFLKKFFSWEIIAYSFQTEKNKIEIDIARKNTKTLWVKHLVIDMEKYNSNEMESDIFSHEWLVKLPNLWKILKEKFPEYKDIKVEFWWDWKEELINSNTHFPYKAILAKYKFFQKKWEIDDYIINQEFLNREMFDFNLQIIDKITLRNWIERRLPFTDYELLKFKNYKNYRKEVEKFLNNNWLEIVVWEFWYNLWANFEYSDYKQISNLKKYLFEKLNENV